MQKIGIYSYNPTNFCREFVTLSLSKGARKKIPI